MNKTLIVSGVAIVLVAVGGVSLILHSSSNASVANTAPAAVAVAAPSAAAVQATSSVPLMQPTTQRFSQYTYVNNAHEVFPVSAADTKTALGAFSYTKTALGDGAYRFTLTNSAEGYKGQSVVVGSGQTLYFIEPTRRDDSASEDSRTTDDFFVVVNAAGYLLQ